MVDINQGHEVALVIGNGFDLNLGLPTRYQDFLQSSEFNSLIKPDSIFSHLQNRINLNGWVDVEVELKKYSNDFNDPNFETDYKLLCNALINYINGIDYTVINNSAYAFKLFEHIKGKDFVVFDFNYTSTFHKIGNELGFDLQDLESRIFNVHGSAKEGRIIFGVEDMANIKAEHIFLKKSYPTYFKAINLKPVLKNSHEVHFFGHSLGETDHTYFQSFFLFASNIDIPQQRTIYLYYYDDNAFKNLSIQLDVLTNKSLTNLKQGNIFKPIIVG